MRGAGGGGSATQLWPQQNQGQSSALAKQNNHSSTTTLTLPKPTHTTPLPRARSPGVPSGRVAVDAPKPALRTHVCGKAHRLCSWVDVPTTFYLDAFRKTGCPGLGRNLQTAQGPSKLGIQASHPRRSLKKVPSSRFPRESRGINPEPQSHTDESRVTKPWGTRGLDAHRIM